MDEEKDKFISILKNSITSEYQFKKIMKTLKKIEDSRRKEAKDIKENSKLDDHTKSELQYRIMKVLEIHSFDYTALKK